MNGRNQGSPAPYRGGIFLPCLIFIFVLISVVGLVFFLMPSATVSRGLASTLSALEDREEATLFPLSVLKEGALTLSEEKGGVFYNASSDGTLSATLNQGEKELSLFARGDKVTLGTKFLPEKTFTSTRNRGALDLWDSGIDLSLLTKEDRALTLALLSLSDPALYDFDSLLALAGEAFPVGRGKLSTEKGEYLYGNESIALRKYTYTYSAKNLEKAFADFAKTGSGEAVQGAVNSKFALLSALTGKKFSPTEAEIANLFLSGKGETFAEWKALALAEGANLAITYGMKGGKVILLTANFSSGETSVSFELFFGENVKKDGDLALSFTLQKGEDTVLEAKISHKLSENSRTAFVREVEYTLSDPGGILVSSETGKLTGKIRYSWGKEKGDVGLRVITPEGQIGLSGMVEEYKKGKSLRLRISRFEVDRINRLEGSLILTLSKKPGEEKPLSEGQSFLLTPEEQAARAEEFFSRYQSDSGGTT